MSWIGYLGGSVQSATIPATSEMRLDLYVDNDGGPPPESVRWRCGNLVLGVTPGSGGRIDLRPAVDGRSLTAECRRPGRPSFNVTKTVRFVKASEADEARYGNPLMLGQCRVSYANLERLTPAQAVARSKADGVVRGALIAGAIPSAISAEDCVIEARASVETMVAASSTLTRSVVTGLSREDDGTPLAIYRIRQHLAGSGYNCLDTALEWMNDGWTNAKNGSFVGGVIRNHCNYIYNGDRQHPDAIQFYGTGNATIDGTRLENTPPSVPVGRDGAPVPFIGVSVDKKGKTWSGPSGSAGIMFNQDYPYVAPVRVANIASIDTSSVHLNIGLGLWQNSLLTLDNIRIEGNWGTVVRALRSKTLEYWPSPDADWNNRTGSPKGGTLRTSPVFRMIGADSVEGEASRPNVVWS